MRLTEERMNNRNLYNIETFEFSVAELASH